MLIIMFWLSWDFTLIAVAITPFVLLMISRFKKAIKRATKEVRKQQSGAGALSASGESNKSTAGFTRM